MKLVAIFIISVLLPLSYIQASEQTPTGVYQTESVMYSLTVTLLENGNYLARWDADIGSNGTASGSWKAVENEVRLTPKKEEGRLMPRYLRVLLLRDFEGRRALIRKEDIENERNPYFYLYRKQTR